MDGVNKAHGQTVKKLVLRKMLQMMTSDKEMSDNVTSQIISLNDMMCRTTQTSIKKDYTELTDFPSSEDLDAFLANMKVDCENILM